MDPPIVFTDVCKSYDVPPAFVVRDFSLSIRREEFFCLVGASGCGKSTLLKMIAGIEQPTTGTLLRPERVGMVFQSYALLPWLSVRENAAFAPKMQRLPDEKAYEIADRYLRMVHLESYCDKLPRELSGGQRQRIGIARALAVQADVMLLDEPFSALDPIITDELHDDLLEIWQETKKTVVMVSHSFEEAVTLADRVGIVCDGRLKSVIAIDLPRPRIAESLPFVLEVKKVREALVHA